MSRKTKSSPTTDRAIAKLIKSTRSRPTLGIVLGSGFNAAISKMKVELEIPYSHIPGFPATGVSGHAGSLLLGMLSGVEVAVLSGRCHYYEGHGMEDVTFAIRTLAGFGIRDILLTNAAGGLNRFFKPGDFMLIEDHINFMGVNPLRGPVAAGLPRFVDMTCAYDPGLGTLLARAAKKCSIKLRKGIYLAVSGPSYETPAEIRAFKKLGADAVGMSTVPEVIVARQLGMRVAAISCITNPGAGLGETKLSHQEVLETAGKSSQNASMLLQEFCDFYGALKQPAPGQPDISRNNL